MNKHKIFLIVQSALCIVLTILLAASVIGIFREGSARKAENPLEWIFTREKTADRLRPIAPLFFFTIAFASAGLILNIRDENSEKPSKGYKFACSQNTPKESGRTISTVRLIVLIAAVCLIAAGIYNGSAKDVWGKAVRICSECIGLG